MYRNEGFSTLRISKILQISISETRYILTEYIDDKKDEEHLNIIGKMENDIINISKNYSEEKNFSRKIILTEQTNELIEQINKITNKFLQ